MNSHLSTLFALSIFVPAAGCGSSGISGTAETTGIVASGGGAAGQPHHSRGLCTPSNTSPAPANGLIADFSPAGGGANGQGIETSGRVVTYASPKLVGPGSMTYSTTLTAAKKWGKDFTLHPVGTGPFKFVEWVRGDRVVLERNDDYYEGKSRLDKIIVRTVREDSARVLGLQAGDYDVAVRIPPEDVSRLMSEGRVRVYAEQSNRVLYIGFNLAKKPFDDVRVRQALNYAIDKDSIVKNIYQDRAAVVPNVVGPLNTGYAAVKGYGYDPVKAKKLLAEAGYPNGLEISFWTPKGRYLKDYELSQAIQQQLAAVGITAKLEAFEWARYLSTLRRPKGEAKFDMYLLGFAASSGEARWVIYGLSSCDQWPPAGNNAGFYCNKAVDQAVDRAVVSRNAKERDAFMRKAQEILTEDPIAIYLLATKETVGMSLKVSGIINSPLELVYADKDTWKEK